MLKLINHSKTLHAAIESLWRRMQDVGTLASHASLIVHCSSRGSPSLSLDIPGIRRSLQLQPSQPKVFRAERYAERYKFPAAWGK